MLSQTRAWLGRPLPLHALLFAAYPVLFLFAQNLTEVTVGEVFPPLGRALLAAGAVALVAGLVLRDLRRGALIATVLVIAWFAFGHVADLLVPMNVSLNVQLFAWGTLILFVALAALFLSRRWVGRVTSALNVVALVLVTIALAQVVPYEMSRPASAAEPARAVAAPVGARDIYYFIFDRYGSDAALQAWLGMSNDLPAWLTSQGFYVAADSHANYIRTTLSLAATLDMKSLDSVAAKMGRTSGDLSPVDEMIQDNAAGLFLEARGYRYIHMGSWFGPTQTVRIATQNLHLDTTTDFEAMLDKTTFDPTLDSLLKLPVVPQQDAIHRDNALYELQTLPSVEAEPGPKFVFAHILLPHPPYVFNADGSYPSAEEQKTRTETQSFQAQLTYTNAQIRDIVTNLLSVPPDRQPIIVFQADEGPYPDAYQANEGGFDWSTATTDQLETKYGILNALYLPGDAPAGAPEPYSTMTSWNTFPIILDRYFGASFPLMPDRSYTSSSLTKPYDFTDITDRLPSPAGY